MYTMSEKVITARGTEVAITLMADIHVFHSEGDAWEGIPEQDTILEKFSYKVEFGGKSTTYANFGWNKDGDTMFSGKVGGDLPAPTLVLAGVPSAIIKALADKVREMARKADANVAALAAAEAAKVQAEDEAAAREILSIPEGRIFADKNSEREWRVAYNNINNEGGRLYPPHCHQR
jgi:hypothetical protein